MFVFLVWDGSLVRLLSGLIGVLLRERVEVFLGVRILFIEYLCDIICFEVSYMWYVRCKCMFRNFVVIALILLY